MKENELIQKCKQNEYAAQMQVYNSYKNMMFSSCVRLLKNKQDAEDVVHDSFIKAFQKIDQIKNDTNLGAWLKRIAINNSIDFIRKRQKAWTEDAEIIDQEDEPYEIEDTQLTVEYIKKCMSELKEKYSIILSLYMIEDYSHKEIAKMLDLKESTVRNQYRRGKQQLLKLIQVKAAI